MKKPSGFVKFLLWFIGIIFLLTFIGVYTSYKEGKLNAVHYSIGDSAILNNNQNKENCSGIILLSETEDIHKDITSKLLNKDSMGVEKYINQGKAFWVKNCEKVVVVESKSTILKVKSINNKIIEGWVDYEFIK